MKLLYLLFVVFIIVAGCQRAVPEKSYWSGSLHRTDKKEIPFRAFIDLQSRPMNGYFLVGDEKTLIPEIIREGDSLELLFSEYHAAMRGIVKGTSWTGNYIRYRNTAVSIPFTASADEPGLTATHQPSKPAIPLVGKFQAYVQQETRVDSTTVGTFWIKNDSIYGTLIAPDGDYGLNVGVQRGTSVVLSRFTGWQAQMFEFGQDGSSWKGIFYVRNEPPELITLEPRPSLPPTISGTRETKVKKATSLFVFSGVTSNGDSLTNQFERFRGKALIVDIMGTWCHNCMDEAPVLEQLYKEFNDKGLEVVGLSFEINDNPEQAKRNLRLYQQRFGLSYPLLFCGSTDDKYVGPALRSQLDNFYAYPTALFINKKGQVEYIHIGFKGPGTGEEFQAEVKHIYDVVKSLIGS